LVVAVVAVVATSLGTSGRRECKMTIVEDTATRC
jgi:hypothetical protein